MNAMKAVIAAGVGGALVAAALPVQAHHSFPATYHVERQTTIVGEVVQFQYRNPHSFVHVRAPDKSGKIQRWAVEWGGGSALAGEGVTATTLKPGDKVTVIGNPGRVESDHRIKLQRITRPADGWTWGGKFD